MALGPGTLAPDKRPLAARRVDTGLGCRNADKILEAVYAREAPTAGPFTNQVGNADLRGQHVWRFDPLLAPTTAARKPTNDNLKPSF